MELKWITKIGRMEMRWELKFDMMDTKSEFNTLE